MPGCTDWRACARTLGAIAFLALISLGLMLLYASPELSWDEADYALASTGEWRALWAEAGYARHFHGPMDVYLTKLGRELLPAGLLTFEAGSRFFVAVAGSLSVGFMYWALRRVFATSRPAALVGSGLLLLSVIRLEETAVIGPHHPMLLSVLIVLTFAFHWRERPTLATAAVLGIAISFGALSMTYAVPLVVCWVIAMGLAGREWFRAWWAIPSTLGIAALVMLAVWPPGILHGAFLEDFLALSRFSNHPTLVGDRIFEVTPRSAAFRWLGALDGPLAIVTVSVVSVALFRAWRRRGLSPLHRYLVFVLLFFGAVALAAHLAGARNLLLVEGVACLAAGALFDEALDGWARLAWPSSALTTLAAVANLAWHAYGTSYTPFFATDGYRAFLRENRMRVLENATAVVYGLPILELYARELGTGVGWDVYEMPWTTRADASFPPDTKYVLIPEFVCTGMPANQPMRRIVADTWRVVWTLKNEHAWELRLYQRP